MRVHSQARMRAMPRMSSGGMRVHSQARMSACRCTHARMSRGGGAVSKRTYSPGQKEHVISVQYARALAGAHARNAAHVERRHARALAGAHECMSMHACAHVARRRRGFEENVLAWTEGTHDQCAACAYTRRCACAQCRACRAAACACNRRHACVHVNASMRACRAAAARFRRERNRLDRRNT